MIELQKAKENYPEDLPDRDEFLALLKTFERRTSLELENHTGSINDAAYLPKSSA